jgi:hypothetical protein
MVASAFRAANLAAWFESRLLHSVPAMSGGVLLAARVQRLSGASTTSD